MLEGHPKVLCEGVLESGITDQFASPVSVVVINWPDALKPVERLIGAMEAAVVKVLEKAVPALPAMSL